MFLPLFIASLLVMAVSLVGIVATWKSLGGIIERNLHLLVSFAAGVFIILVGNLSREVIEGASTVVIGLSWILAGLIITSLTVKLIPQAHHHHEEHDEHKHHTRIDARRMLVSDSFHNFGDGILLAASFLAGPALGIAALAGIVAHEVVQEISEFFVFRQAGYSVKRTLKVNFISSGTILIGSIGGYFLLGTFEMLEVPVLGIAAGALLTLLLQDLIPHSVIHAHKQKCLPQHIIAITLGVALMLCIFYVTAPLHSHGNTEQNNTEELLT